jgi:hypothetical protein
VGISPAKKYAGSMSREALAATPSIWRVHPMRASVASSVATVRLVSCLAGGQERSDPGMDTDQCGTTWGFGRARRLDTVVDVQRVLLLGRRDGV